MTSSLKQRALSGIFWVGATGVVSRGVSFAATLILAKLLTPKELGLVAVGWLIIGTTGLFRDMGINRALIYQKDRIQEVADTAFYLIPIISAVLYTILFFCAPLFAIFFREPEIVWFVRFLGLSLLIQSFAEVPAALLEKEVQFKQTALPETFNLVVYSIGAVVLAWLGFSYWSIVMAQLAGELVRLVAIWYLSTWRPTFRFYKEMLRDLINYSKYIMGSTIINFGIRNMDDAIVGRMLGMDVLGVYTFAYRLANLPATNITNIIARVMMPVFTKMAHRTDELRAAFLKTLKYTASVNIPVSFLIITLSGDFLQAFYGDKWIDAILPIQILSLFGLCRALGSGTGSVFLAVGRPDISMQIVAVQFGFMALLIYPVTRWFGLTGICILVTLGAFGSVVAAYRAARPLIHFTFRQLLAAVFMPMGCATSSILIVGVIRHTVQLDANIFTVGGMGLLMIMVYAIQMIAFDQEYRALWQSQIVDRIVPRSKTVG